MKTKTMKLEYPYDFLIEDMIDEYAGLINFTEINKCNNHCGCCGKFVSKDRWTYNELEIPLCPECSRKDHGAVG